MRLFFKCTTVLTFAFLLISQIVNGQDKGEGPGFVEHKKYAGPDSLNTQNYYLEHVSPSTEIFNLPIIGYNPQTGTRVGLALNMIFYPKPGKNQSYHNMPSVIMPMIAVLKNY